MTTTNNNSINNNSINNNVKFYTLDGEQVFLADRCEMDALGINPIDKWSVDSFGIAAYSASDYQQGIETRMTYLEDYAGGYSDDNDEIYLGKVVNPEGGNIIDGAWILESDRRDVCDELNEAGDYQGDEELDEILGVSGYEELKDAMFEWGSDPQYLETTEDAFRVYNILRKCKGSIEEVITSECGDYDYHEDLDGLNVTDASKYYMFVNGCAGSICLERDYTSTK